MSMRIMANDWMIEYLNNDLWLNNKWLKDKWFNDMDGLMIMINDWIEIMNFKILNDKLWNNDYDWKMITINDWITAMINDWITIMINNWIMTNDRIDKRLNNDKW